MDPRIARTRQALRDALIELIEEIGFERITIRQLADRAGINRGTFYLHFKDKRDLLAQSKRDLLLGLKRIIDRFAAERTVIVKMLSTGEPNPFLVAVFEYFEEHAKFLRTLLGPKGDPAFPQEWRELMMRYATEQLDRLDWDAYHRTIPKNYFAAYVVSTLIGIAQEWLNSDPRLPPREIADIIVRINQLTPGTLFNPS